MQRVVGVDPGMSTNQVKLPLVFGRYPLTTFGKHDKNATAVDRKKTFCFDSKHQIHWIEADDQGAS